MSSAHICSLLTHHCRILMKNYKLLSVCAFKDSNKVLMAKVDNLEGCTVDAATSCHQSMTYPEGEEGP